MRLLPTKFWMIWWLLLDPRFMRLKAIFNVRGGIYTTVESEHRKKNWLPRDIVSL